MQTPKRPSRIAQSAPATEHRRHTILVVEPNPDQQWQMARQLTVGGHRVIGTASCDGALALLGQYPVDLVLMAEELPRTDGVSLAARLRKSNPALRIVIVGDPDEPESTSDPTRSGVRPHVDPELAGAVDFLPRPLPQEALAALLADMDSSAA